MAEDVIVGEGDVDSIEAACVDSVAMKEVIS
jgi:hypothetical protein